MQNLLREEPYVHAAGLSGFRNVAQPFLSVNNQTYIYFAWSHQFKPVDDSHQMALIFSEQAETIARLESAVAVWEEDDFSINLEVFVLIFRRLKHINFSFRKRRTQFC